MNTDYQIVAAGTISPINTHIAESTDERELQRYQANRDSRLKKMPRQKNSWAVSGTGSAPSA